MKDKFEHYYNWKIPSVSEKQLELNKNEISSKEKYPSHWRFFIDFMEKIKPNSILDLGCGVGAYAALIKENNLPISYFGIDYSETAILIAKKQWGYGDFCIMDFRDLTTDFINRFDLIHMGALLDVLPDADEALKFILSLGPKKVLISRIEMTKAESNFSTYEAYEIITTYSFKHNQKELIMSFESFGYDYEFINNNVFLAKNTH